MPRFTSFALDLALIGGQNKISARQLPWDEFMDYWKKQLPPGPLFPRFSTTAHKLVWTPTWQAPSEWSTSLWPDFAYSDDDDHDARAQAPLTLLHMALRDSVEGAYGAREAVPFLLGCGVSPNVWPGHGSTAMAQACLLAHVPSVAALVEYGHDLQVRLANDAQVRENFKGSSLLHRVGPALAARASRAVSGKKKSDRAKRAEKMLKFLVEHTPDPQAPDAQGRSALGLVCQAAPNLASELEAIVARRQAMSLANAWDVSAQGSVDLSEHVRAVRSWAAKGRAVLDGEPRRFALLEEPSWTGPGPVPRALRCLAAGESAAGAVWLRADEIHHTPEALTAGEALALAQAHKAHAVVSGKGAEAVWWAFNPKQLAPAVSLEVTPSPSASMAGRPRL